MLYNRSKFNLKRLISTAKWLLEKQNQLNCTSISNYFLSGFYCSRSFQIGWRGYLPWCSFRHRRRRTRLWATRCAAGGGAAGRRRRQSPRNRRRTRSRVAGKRVLKTRETNLIFWLELHFLLHWVHTAHALCTQIREHAQLVSPGLYWARPSTTRWQHMWCVPSALCNHLRGKYIRRKRFT